MSSSARGCVNRLKLVRIVVPDVDIPDRLIEANRRLNLIVANLRKLSELPNKDAGTAKYHALVAKIRADADEFKRLTKHEP